MPAVKLGTEDKKKVYILGGLLTVAAVVYYLNSGSPSDTTTPPSTAARPSPAAVPRPSGAQTSAARPNRPNDRSSREFRPTLKPKKPEDRPDPTTIDPTLRLDLLSKVQAVSVEGVHRNVFEFSQAPAVEAAKVAASKVKVPSPIVPTPAQIAATTSATPPTPQAPPVPLKFYGYISASNQGGKRAFFVEGEDIHVVTEGDMVKQRYKIVRIGINSVVVEDTQFKSQQTLPLEEQPG